jgi:hypothetical protein
MMENSIQVTDVQFLNLNYLTTIQACLRSERLAAIYKFHLDPETATKLTEMTTVELQLLAANMPHESLFKPVDNLADLLDAPPALAMLLCAAGTCQPVNADQLLATSAG